MKTAVIVFPGSNCDRDAAMALEAVTGQKPAMVWVNDYLSGMFMAVGIRLIDFKLEFGRVYDQNDMPRVILADEISPDSCRLWDAHTNEKLDKDRFRRDLGNVTEAYAEVARRLGIMKENGSVTEEGSPE